MKLLDKFLFWIKNSEFLITSNGPSTFGIIFKDGDSYQIDGIRLNAVHFECRSRELRRLPCNSGLIPKDESEVIKILKDELSKRGMVITIY